MIKPRMFACICLGMVSASEGAVLSGTVNTSPSGPVNLTATGTTNWAIWNFTTDTVVAGPRVATNRKNTSINSGSPGFISGISNIGGTGVRGSSSSPTITYTYSDGISPVNLSTTTQGTALANSFDTPGSGLSLTVTGDPSQMYRVSVWATGYSGVGRLTASLNNADPVALDSQSFTNVKSPVLFTFDFQPDSATDLLTLSYTLFSQPGTGDLSSSHVEIQAVTVSAIPEASTSLALIGSIGLLVFRRRR